MKTKKRISLLYTIFILCSLLMISCKKYLDKSPEATITDKDVFTSFQSFEGYTEQLYDCMPDMGKSTWNDEFNFADEVISTTAGTYRLNTEFDNGNYWAWYHNGWVNSWLDDMGTPPTTNEAHGKGLWGLSWYGIRVANEGLANLDLLTNATQDQKNVIKGQLLFFRGFFHFQLMSYWGGLPYIDTVLSSSGKLTLPRLTYQETAIKAAQDFEAAAALLPANWDNSPAGQATKGNNNERITKSVALAYEGKDLLYAASPLMNSVSGGSATYNQDLCKQSADCFYRCLKLSDDGEAVYQLMPFAQYNNIFYTISGNQQLVPGYPEVLLAPPSFAAWESRWSQVNIYVPPSLGGEAAISAPAANYVDNYGMANGLPINAAGSGYNIADPWTGRDPRFYKAIVYDGMQMIQGNGGDPSLRFAQLYTGGNLRIENSASRTGYLLRKFITAGCNNVDNEWNNINIIIPYLRLADVYLMYAEAVMYGYGSPQSSYPGYMTAIDAVNKVRARSGVPGIDARYLGSNEAFMPELIRERAVELSFEGLRFMDLRRWMLAGQAPYLQKTAIDFDRGSNGKPINLKYRVVTTRIFENKHYWLPLPVNQVNLYPGFGQNPGW